MMGALGARKAITGVDLRARRLASEALVAQGLLGEEPPGWDPVEVARGREMRANRSAHKGTPSE